MRAGDEAQLASHALPDHARVELHLRARGYELEFLHDGLSLATVDARQLDASSTGGFLGLWLGVCASSSGRVAQGQLAIETFEYTGRRRAVTERPAPR